MFFKKESPKEIVGPVTAKEATAFIQRTVQNPDKLGQERAQKNKNLIESVLKGTTEDVLEAKELIKNLIEEYGVEITDMSLDDAVENMYSYMWGLGPLEDIYYDPQINEIQVNSYNQVYIIRDLKTEQTDIHFEDDEHIRNIIQRMVMHDRGVSLNESNSTIESMRRDGTRITATCPPVSENTTLVLRKQLVKILTLEDLIRSKTLDEKTWNLLTKLVKGRANILLSGGVGSGKTSLMRALFSITHPKARTLVLENDRELFLHKHFPERNIIEFEEHPEAGASLSTLFRTLLRYSPNIIIVGEFRGAGEAREAIRACERGHHGSMATAHFSSPKEAIEGTGRLLLEEGLNIPASAATLMVAGAYNVVIQMFGDTTRGIIKVDSVTEVDIESDEVVYRDLIKWVPETGDYTTGDWVVKNQPGPRLTERLGQYGVEL
jgi:pilus assembly protein CpaF